MARQRLPNVVDSSAWLEYLADGPSAEHFAAAVEATDDLIIPSICILEVFKAVLRQRGESDALQAAALMQQGAVIELDAPLALAAAKVGHDLKLALADSIVYATAQHAGAVLWTQDVDFETLARVKYFPKAK